MLIFRGVSTTRRIPWILLKGEGGKHPKTWDFLQTPPVIFSVLFEPRPKRKTKGQGLWSIAKRAKRKHLWIWSTKNNKCLWNKKQRVPKILINSHEAQKNNPLKTCVCFFGVLSILKHQSYPQQFSINHPLWSPNNKTPDLSPERVPNSKVEKCECFFSSCTKGEALHLGGQTAPIFPGELK